jgi:ribonuclease BN (tRNA processing enzyme)
MITLDILGCGEAFDPDRANSSVLIRADGFTLLIDCGMGVAQAVWQRSDDADFIDTVYFTHLHVDHAGGFPALLDHMASRGRTRPLRVIGPPDGAERIAHAIAFAAWPGDSLPFPVLVQSLADAPRIGPFAARYAQTDHSATNHAIRLEANGRSLFYSGDGRPTPASRALMHGADVAFHETQAISRDAPIEGHCDFDTVAVLQAAEKIGQMWLYHTGAGTEAAFAARLTTASAALRFARAGLTVTLT